MYSMLNCAWLLCSSVFLAWRNPAKYRNLTSHTLSMMEAITTTTSTSTTTATHTSRGRSSRSRSSCVIFRPTRPAWAPVSVQAERRDVVVEGWGWRLEVGMCPWAGAGEVGRRWGSWRGGSRQMGKCSTWWSGKTWVCTNTRRVNRGRNDCFAVATGVLSM